MKFIQFHCYLHNFFPHAHGRYDFETPISDSASLLRIFVIRIGNFLFIPILGVYLVMNKTFAFTNDKIKLNAPQFTTRKRKFHGYSNANSFQIHLFIECVLCMYVCVCFTFCVEYFSHRNW